MTCVITDGQVGWKEGRLVRSGLQVRERASAFRMARVLSAPLLPDLLLSFAVQLRWRLRGLDCSPSALL